MADNLKTLEVLFTPVEFAALTGRDLSDTVCVVFDIFRATSTIVTALANGAAAIVPVAEIPEALAIRRQQPEVLLAGERHGVRIRADLTGGVDFDLGNSPREFTPERIRGKTIVLSTTNGSRALRACAKAQTVLAASFLNLRATADQLHNHPASNILLVCSGTGEQAAYEDILGAGALADVIWPFINSSTVSDSVTLARQIYRQYSSNLFDATIHSRNGRRLLSMPELHNDVRWCLQRNIFPIIAEMKGGKIENAIDGNSLSWGRGLG